MASQFAAAKVYLNSQGEMVGADDPDKTTLVAAAGAPVPERHLAAYEAFVAASAPAEQPAAAAPEAEAKAVRGPAQTKAVAGPEGSK
jgi:hypothetical protein